MHLLLYIFNFIIICSAINATLIKCNKYKLNNGRVRMKPNSKFARFYCQRGYMLIGTKYSGCINGYFDTYPPICVNNKPNCKKIPGLKNGLIIPEANNVVVHFFCKPEYTLVGPNVTVCDGSNWLLQLPNCKPNGSEPETSCDFENEDICGWSHDLNHDFDWKRTNSETPSPETGPRFDHTKGIKNNGHYMYIESTSRAVNDTSRLISPIFGKMSQICVSFYYHMFGRDMGTLNVYIKQENERFEKLKPRFSVGGNQGDLWHLGLISLENGTAGSFQVIFEGLRGTTYFSDIAIDDVSIDEEMCPEEAPETTEFQFSTETSEIPYFDSCLNRCGENVTNFDYISTCSCDENCFDLNLCCADFVQLCLLGTSVDYEEIVETSTIEMSSDTTETDLTSDLTTNTPIISIIPAKIQPTTTYPTTKQRNIYTKPTEKIIPQHNPKIFTKPTTTSTVKNTPKTIKTTQNTPKTIKTTQSTPKTIKTTPKLIETTPKTIKTTQITSNFQDVLTQQPDVQFLKNAKSAEKSNNLYLYLGVSVSLAVATVFVVFAIIFVRRNDFNCKKFTGSRNTDSMSDVRFLASDEVLDFTWKRAESL